MKLGGDFTNEGAYVSFDGDYSIVFDGFAKQNVSKLSAPMITIKNDSDDGVIFNSRISSFVLFDHKGNNFTLYNDGSDSNFVDYDGDGLKDNVDPEPTVGKPCTLYFKSEDIEKGTVSLNLVETIGGTKITVTATPTFKYDFSKWINSAGATVSTSAECALVAKGDNTYIAIFTKRQKPITTQTNGGKINVASKAEIESEVKVTIIENDGYVYTEGSLAYNGITIKNDSFIMPDEPVIITAEFLKNEGYFALKEALEEAKCYTYEAYSKESFANLSSVIKKAESVLINNITAEESEMQISLLKKAINGLKKRYVTSITLQALPIFYVNIVDTINSISLIVIYDNGITQTIKGADCVITGFDFSVSGEQLIDITYGSATLKVPITVYKRELAECTFSNIVDKMLYDGIKELYTQEPIITYNLTREVLTENVDYMVTYMNNVSVGEATIIITGIGDFTGSKTFEFNIYCEHNYSEYNIIKKATYENVGIMQYICYMCKDAQDFEIPMVALPIAPELERKEGNTLVLKWVDGYEYSLDGETWQSSNVFNMNDDISEYTFFQRIAETEFSEESCISEKLTVEIKIIYDDCDIDMEGFFTDVGDIDGDENVNLNDLITIAQYVAGWENLEVNEPALDVNGDGTVDLNDVNHFARYLAGWGVVLY